MKFKNMIVIFLLSVFSFLDAQSPWQYITDNPPNVGVYSTCLINNTVYFWCTQNIVYRTKDGGKSFEIFLPYAPTENTSLGCCDRHGISFADSLTGYITDAAHGEFRTEDGGKTWVKKASSGAASELVDFGSAKIGWKVGRGFYKTTDSGNNWKFISVPFWEGGIYSNIFALDENNVWVLKSYYNGRKPEGSIWYSSNGGTKWKRLNTGLKSSDSLHVEYYDLLMKPNGLGVAVGRLYKPGKKEYNAFIQRTDDFGTTWTTLEIKDMSLKNILSPDDSTWIILGNIGPFLKKKVIQLRSTDSAKSWVESYPMKLKYTSYYNYFNAAEYIPKFNCILAATVQGLYKSVDKGKTYFHITTERDLYAKEINVERNPKNPSTQMLITRSFNREYLFSADAGKTWVKKEIPAELGFQIWHVKIASGVIYMVVDQLRLYKSDDQGSTWVQIVPSNFQAGLLGLDALNENVLVINNYPNLCTTFDGGVSWLRTPFSDAFWLNDSYLLSPNEISAIGIDLTDYAHRKGFFYHTSDNGYNWRIQSADHPIDRFTFVSNKIGYAMSKTQIYKTNDGGYSWQGILSNSKAGGSFSAICFFDSLQGLVHSGHTFLETKDGGKTWQKVAWKFPYEYAEQLAVNQNGDVFALSNGSLLYYPNYFEKLSKPQAIQENNNFLIVKNFPNPFNNRTKIRINLPSNDQVTVKIYNTTGQLVKMLYSGILQKGKHQLIWDGTNNSGLSLPSGIYFLHVSTERNLSLTFKLIMIK